MSKWNDIAQALYMECSTNTEFSKEEITNIAILYDIVKNSIRSNTWNALISHNILCPKENNKFLLLPEEKKEIKNSNKGARQNHGFEFEEYIKNFYNISSCPKGHYTYKWDGILNNIPVSIKTEKLGSDIEMASFMRNAQNEEDFYLIVGFWEKDKSNIVAIETLLINGKEWHNLFNQEIVQECQEFLNSISNDASDDENWKTGRENLSKKWQKETTNLIRPRFKRDHKSQKRMQCAINNNDFYSYFIPKYAKELK